MPDEPQIFRLYHKGVAPLSWLVRWATRQPGFTFGQTPGHVSTVVVDTAITRYESTWPRVRSTTLTADQWSAIQRDWRGHGLVCPPVKRQLQEPAGAVHFLIHHLGRPYGLLPLLLDAIYFCTRSWCRRNHIALTIRRSRVADAPDCAEYANLAEAAGRGFYLWSADPVPPSALLVNDTKNGLLG